jgi:hypothetical protein
MEIIDAEGLIGASGYANEKVDVLESIEKSITYIAWV